MPSPHYDPISSALAMKRCTLLDAKLARMAFPYSRLQVWNPSWIAAFDICYIVSTKLLRLGRNRSQGMDSVFRDGCARRASLFWFFRCVGKRRCDFDATGSRTCKLPTECFLDDCLQSRLTISMKVLLGTTSGHLPWLIPYINKVVPYLPIPALQKMIKGRTGLREVGSESSQIPAHTDMYSWLLPRSRDV